MLSHFDLQDTDARVRGSEIDTDGWSLWWEGKERKGGVEREETGLDENQCR